MMSKAMNDAINKQINAEIYSSYLYLAMAAYFESKTLPGFGAWMKVQANEEMGHAMKFYAYVNERAGRVVFDAIPKPPTNWKSTLAVFETVCEHEAKVTNLIYDLAGLAEKGKDRATEVFLQWFISEQVEEEANAKQITDTLTMIGESNNGLLMLDHRLGKRQAGGCAS